MSLPDAVALCGGYAIKMDIDILSASCKELGNGRSPLQNAQIHVSSAASGRLTAGQLIRLDRSREIRNVGCILYNSRSVASCILFGEFC